MSRDSARPRHPVVLVEGDADIRRLVEILLTRSDRLALSGSFDNAESALLTIADGSSPAAILCGIGLTGMSGLEAIPLLRDACPDTVIVTYTADLQRARGAVALGADAVVGKNTIPSLLPQMLLDLIEKRNRAEGGKAAATSRRWPSGHLAWAFSGSGQFDGAVAAFLTEGATLGERLVLVTDDPRPQLVMDALVDQGDLLVLSTSEVYSEDRIVDAVTQRETFHATYREAIELGYAGLRVAADNTSLATGPERMEAWLRWESEADNLMRTHAITGLCAFDRTRLDARSLDTLMNVHANQPDPALL
jgi:CheY-like chemotaxis protein